jgi:hypothetical protein
LVDVRDTTERVIVFAILVFALDACRVFAVFCVRTEAPTLTVLIHKHRPKKATKTFLIPILIKDNSKNKIFLSRVF